MRDWIKKGGALPKDPVLAKELLMPKVLFHGGQLRLEEKEQAINHTTYGTKSADIYT